MTSVSGLTFRISFSASPENRLPTSPSALAPSSAQALQGLKSPAARGDVTAL
jgi:hypothetical protein